MKYRSDSYKIFGGSVRFFVMTDNISCCTLFCTKFITSVWLSEYGAVIIPCSHPIARSAASLSRHISVWWICDKLTKAVVWENRWIYCDTEKKVKSGDTLCPVPCSGNLPELYLTFCTIFICLLDIWCSIGLLYLQFSLNPLCSNQCTLKYYYPLTLNKSYPNPDLIPSQTSPSFMVRTVNWLWHCTLWSAQYNSISSRSFTWPRYLLLGIFI